MKTGLKVNLFLNCAKIFSQSGLTNLLEHGLLPPISFPSHATGLLPPTRVHSTFPREGRLLMAAPHKMRIAEIMGFGDICTQFGKQLSWN